MTSNPLLKYLPTITRIINSTGDLTMVDAPPGFPFDLAYPGQVGAVRDIRENDSILLSSATGSGKTACFLSASYPHKSTLVVEPRKYLQIQTANYRKDCVVFGRSEYPCHFEENAADAPCRGKKEIYLIGEIPVKMFTVFDEKTGKEERHSYPCKDCEYINAVQNALYTIKNGGTVISNFGNYFPYLSSADVIVIDEADLFFVSVSSAKKLRHIERPKDTTKETLEAELTIAKKEYESLMKAKPDNRDDSRKGARRIDKAKTHVYGIESLLKNSDICFQYTKFDRKTGKTSVYVEVRPDQVNALKDRIFPLKDKDGKQRKVIIATATPGNFTADKVVSYSVFMRTAIFYSPVALMTASNTGKNPDVFIKCADFIIETHEGFKKLLEKDGEKTVVHCGSLAYAKTLASCIGSEKCDVHTSGKLMEIVEGFRTSPAEYLLVTAAEYGANFDYCTHQYILRSPAYASYDERLRAFEAEIGSAKFSDWYALDGLYRTVQQSGRVGRGAGGIGFTFILDRKFASEYGRFGKKLPVPFIEALKRGGTV